MAYLTEIQALDKGASFLNVDLHVHSYGASSDVRDTEMTPEAIVDAAVNQGLSVIALTDHNSDRNVEAALTHAQQYADKLLVLPGVEVTTAHGHLLAYFAPERAADLSKFLSRLDLIGAMGDENSRTTKSMADTIDEAERLGGICVAAHIDRDRTGFDKFAPGFQNWKKDILTHAGLFGIECDSSDHLCWYSDGDEPGSEGNERTKLLNARRAVAALNARQHLASVQGSDAHSMLAFQTKKPDKPWTRVKMAELSFGALRVAMVDPTARVRACASIPRSFPRILGVALTGGFLNGETIHFSDNLTCLIGGRGTGKSTAIRALAYAFGINDEFGECGNCPESVCVFCQDANGVFYRYTRAKAGDTEVKAKEDNSVSDVPLDSFRIEYFGQGELAEVAKDPLNTPQLFQAFLDRHTNLRDLLDAEQTLMATIRENAGRLNPLEVSFLQLAGKRKTLEDIEKKLKIAEEGNLRDVVAAQSKIASEKTVRAAVETIAHEYGNGYTLSGIQRDFDQIVTTAGVCTADETSKVILESLKAALAANNAAVKATEQELNSVLKECAGRLTTLCNELKANHQRLDGGVAAKLADLKARGLAANIPELESLLRQKMVLGKDITAVEQRSGELKQCRQQRSTLLAELRDVRATMTERRKAQLKAINANLSATIKDYTVFVRYDDAGIIDEFAAFVEEKMHGTYCQDQVIENVCSRLTPSEIADLVLARNHRKIATTAKISTEWAEKIVDKLCYWEILFELQTLAKQPKPLITVRTKSTPPRDIPVIQLSDGQRHTILLTIAMLAESNVPLVIDQPEDDLDNAFIFSSIVTTLRAIKEKRQVILVTHNANIAVLGDSELLLPMQRENDYGKCVERGSIDREATKICVQNILEGGPAAFLRRKEIYGY